MFRFLLVFLVAHVLSSSVADGVRENPSELLRIGIGSANTMDWENSQDRLWVGGSRGLWVFDSHLELVEQYTDTDYSILSISWNMQGSRLAIGDNEGIIRVHTHDGEVLSPEPVLTIQTNLSNITQVIWSLDGVYLAATSGRNNVGIWFSETGNNVDLPQLIDSIPVTALEWSPVSNTKIGFSSLTEGIIIWDVETQTVNQSVPQEAFNVLSWSQSGKLAAASTGDLYVWEDSLLGEPLQITTLDDGSILSIDWSSDNESVVATGSSGDIYIWTIDDIDIQSASIDYALSTALWSPSNDYIAVVGAGDSLQLRDSTNLNEFARFDEFNSTILEVNWHPNGTQIATIWGRFSQEIRVFDVQTGQMTLRVPRSFTYTLAWNRDGTIIASSPSNVELLLRDALSGDVLDTLQGSDDGWFLFSMDWNPNGDMLATSNGDDVSIWRVEEHKEVNRLQGHTDTITSVDWSPGVLRTKNWTDLRAE